jgi:hypothetical protein
MEENMARRKTLIDKIAKKHFDGKCYFCSCDNYNLLDVHRISYDSNVNKYTDFNTITVCALCHRKIHSGIIKIDRKYFSTSGKWVLHFWVEGEEKWC